MATKDHSKYLKNKHDSTSNDSADVYRNFTLNKNHKCTTAFDQKLSKSVGTRHQRYSNYERTGVLIKGLLDDVIEKTASQKDGILLKKFHKKLSKNYFNTNFNDAKEEKKANNYSSSSSSTLSLHIAAYENFIESQVSDSFTVKELKKKGTAISTLRTPHQQLSGSSCSDHLEFPRQQESSKESKKPEVQQFAASQKLFTPYQGSFSHPIFPKSSVAQIAGAQILLNMMMLRKRCSRLSVFTSSISSRNISEVPSIKQKPIQDYRNHQIHKGVYGAGLSKSGALAIRYLVEKRTAPEAVLRPLKIAFCNSKKITKIAAGCGFSLFANRNELYGSGLNNFYQLGGPVNDRKTDRSEQYYIGGKKISLPVDSGSILDIAAGRLHCLISTENKIYALGNNSHGQCGQDPERHPFVTHNRGYDQLLSISLPADAKVKKVHCTLDTSFLLLTDGRVLSFGLGEDGQTGNGIKGKESWIPQEVGGDLKGERIVRIGGSADTLLAANENGDLFAWGLNEYGQFQMVTDEIQIDYPRHLAFKLGSIVSVGATGSSCVISNSDGLVYTWGAQILGFGPEVSSVPRPMLLDPPLFGSVVNEDGKVSRVFSGCYSMAALTTGGNLFIWGINRFGSLALGHSDDQFFPFQVFLPEQIRNLSLGPDHSIFLTT